MKLRSVSRLTGQETIFPFYHVVSDEHLPHLSHLYHYRNQSQFEEDLEVLLKDFAPVSIEDYLNGKASAEGKAQMVLSFDDGLIECHRYIAPLLKEKGIPAVFFLNNDFIDNRGLFFRYKASLLIEHIGKDPLLSKKAAQFMDVPPEQLTRTLLMISSKNQSLLDGLSQDLGFDEAGYLSNRPVYMSTEHIGDLKKWGFHLGAHGSNHSEFFEMEENSMAAQVQLSVKDLQKRFNLNSSYFAFPFTSDGIPPGVIKQILEEGIAEVLFGTAGLKHTGIRNFIQRIPMEFEGRSAKEVLLAESFYYLMKIPLRRNKYFTGR